MNVLFVYWIFFYILLLSLSSAMGSHGIFDQLCLNSKEAYSFNKKKPRSTAVSLKFSSPLGYLASLPSPAIVHAPCCVSRVIHEQKTSSSLGI